MKYFIQILITLTLVSCSSTKRISIDKIEGKYVWTSIYGVGETIEIKSDSTFIFSWTQGLMNGETLGQIEKNGDKFCLYSELQLDTIKFELEIPPQNDQDYYEIKVINSDRNPLESSFCYLMKDGKKFGGCLTNGYGICNLEFQEIDSINIQMVGFRDAAIAITKNTPKSMIVKLKEARIYEYFEGQKIYHMNKSKLRINTFGRDKIFKRIKKT